MTQFRDITGALKAKTIHYMAGEHDASLDRGDAFQELFGKLNYTFDHKGVHFIVIDNVSDPSAIVGESQLTWLQDDLRKLKKDAPIVVLTHRPLFDLYPQWDWATKDGARAVDLLQHWKNVTVFYGHIHQEHHFMTGHIAHHAAKSLMFPLPGPGSAPKRAPIPWDASAPYKGLGVRDIEANRLKASYAITELPVLKA
jgi:3',5'-cyclic AMP phosphodiesterase CpdA